MGFQRELKLIVFVGVVVLGFGGVRPEDFERTTRSYNLEGPRGDPIRIFEGDNVWEKIRTKAGRSNQRSFQSDSPHFNLDSPDPSVSSLKEFLDTYAKKHHKKPSDIDDDETPSSLDKLIQKDTHDPKSEDKSKSWTLLDVQRHKHPYEDKKGWVSLDPIPWSVSKISKWQSKYKPVSEMPWNDYGAVTSERPWENDFDYKRPVSITPPTPYAYQQSTENPDRYDIYNDHGGKPRPSSVYPRPTAVYGHKVHVETNFPSNSYSSTSRPYLYHNQKDCSHPSHPYEDLIIDDSPSNFPQPSPYGSFRRKGTEIEIHSENHPLKGNGEWILLSTTKGYKPPKSRQRSLNIGTTSEPVQALGTHRSVRLTVLPPLKGSKVNMTTSHGGLLQVESTFESVEQSKQKFDKKIRLKIKNKRKQRKPNKNPQQSELSHQTIATVPRTPSTDPGAVMAAVGAGMIPATMAMMVPIAMSSG